MRAGVGALNAAGGRQWRQWGGWLNVKGQIIEGLCSLLMKVTFIVEEIGRL